MGQHSVCMSQSNDSVKCDYYACGIRQPCLVTCLTLTENNRRFRQEISAICHRQLSVAKGCSRNYPQEGVGHRHFFVLLGEGVLLTMYPRGGGSLGPILSGGWGLSCPGGQGVFDP